MKINNLEMNKLENGIREVGLIKDIDYNYKYLLIDKKNNVLNGDNFLNDTIKLTRTVYSADALVSLNQNQLDIVECIKNNFIETFEKRGGASKEQIHFSEETAKIVFGELKNVNDVITCPAPCGFGKSSISLEILKKLIDLIKTEQTQNGLILVTDRLDSLRDTEKCLKDLGLDGFVYIMEGWNSDICQNRKVKEGSNKSCTPRNCPYYYKCKISKQNDEQYEKPILLITNARLRECGESIKQFSKYEDGERNILLIDERPDFLDNIRVNKKLLNEISTEISKCEYYDVEEKTKLENMWEYIQNIITNKMKKLRKNYKRFIVSNINNEPICKNDKDFMGLWEKYMKGNYKRELSHIHTVLTQGGLYVYEKNVEFITTIGSKDLSDMYSDTFKTIIFDGTSLYDPLYLGMYDRGSIKFLDIENTRTYQNLNINVYMHKENRITKSILREKTYFLKACATFANDKMKKGFSKKAYVITYQPFSQRLSELLDKDYNYAKPNQDECYYFGNTKGKNVMSDCNVMFQFGWDTMPDYEYIIRFLSVCVDWNLTLEMCSSIEEAEKLSENLEVKERNQEQIGNNIYKSQFKCWEFGFSSINQFKLYTIVTNFYQEVHRIKLRNYTCTEEKIEVNIFAIQTIVLKMISQLFPKCKLKEIKTCLPCFKESKADNRKNKGENYTKFKKWLDNQNKNREVSTKELYKESGLNNEQLRGLRKTNSFVKEWFDKHTVKRGVYKV